MRNKEHSGPKVINESKWPSSPKTLSTIPRPPEPPDSRSRGAGAELLRQLHAGGFDRSVRIGKFVEDNCLNWFNVIGASRSALT